MEAASSTGSAGENPSDAVVSVSSADSSSTSDSSSTNETATPCKKTIEVVVKLKDKRAVWPPTRIEFKGVYWKVKVGPCDPDTKIEAIKKAALDNLNKRFDEIHERWDRMGRKLPHITNDRGTNDQNFMNCDYDQTELKNGTSVLHDWRKVADSLIKDGATLTLAIYEKKDLERLQRNRFARATSIKRKQKKKGQKPKKP